MSNSSTITKADIIQFVKQDEWMMGLLKTVKSLNLPDWYIGAGFIRGKVWDILHNYTERTPASDIDVIYLDRTDFTQQEMTCTSTKSEKAHEKKLHQLMPDINWSVTNQARMHLFHHDQPYRTSEEALSQWVETATCIGIKLNTKNQLVLAAPRGIDDLVNLILRPTHPEEKELFLRRQGDKNWLKKWPKLKISI